MRAFYFFAETELGIFLNRGKDVFGSRGKNSITVTLSLWQYLFIQKFAAFGEAQKLCDRNWLWKFHF